MSRQALLHNKSQQPASTGQSSGMLQRTCACDASAKSRCVECESTPAARRVDTTTSASSRFTSNFTGTPLRLQTKLAISQPGDALEQEADRVADQVMASPANPKVSGAPPHIQRYAGQATELMGTAPASVDRVLASSGRPLESALQQDMEQRFGHDFSQVRVHSSVDAEQSARDVNANAYTVGHNVVFGNGRYAPDSNEGKRLVAHELAHVVQQSRGGAAPPLDRHAPHERTAAGTAAQVAKGAAPIVVQGATDIGVARNTQLPGEEDPLPGAFNDSPVTAATDKLPALTADELMERLVLTERGFQASPGGAPINTPKGQGSTLGPGYKTYAGVQIIDKEGNQVISAIGRYVGGGKAHAEADAVRSLWAALQKSKVNVNGMRMMVVVDQTVCESCTSALETFAQDSGITQMDVYLTSREGVTPKTAGRTAAKVGAKAKWSFKRKFPPKPVSANISPGQRGPVPLASEGVPKVRISSDEVGKISEQNTAKPPVVKGGGVNSSEPRVQNAEQSPASNPSAPQVKLRIVDGRDVNTESIVGILGEEESPTSGNLEQAKPAAKQAVAPPPARTPPPTTGSSPSIGKPTPPVDTSAQPAVKPTAAPQQADTPPPTSAKSSIKSTTEPASTTTMSKPSAAPPQQQVGSQGQRVYGGAPTERAVGGQAAFQGAAIILIVAMAKLDAIGKEIQNNDARTKLLLKRQEIIDVLHREPGVGAVIELQFLEPEHRFQDIYWHRTTDAYAGKPTPVAIEEARQPTSTFLYLKPMRSAKPGEKEGGAMPAARAPKEVKSGKEFITTYMQARGADLAGVGTVAVEMYDALQRGNRQFGFADIGAGAETIRLSDANRASIEQEVTSLAEQSTRNKLARLKRGIDTQQARLSEKLKDWFGGSIKLTGHELDPARAHYAAAENYMKDKKFGQAVESINAGDAQVEEVWAALYEYEHGQRPIGPPL